MANTNFLDILNFQNLYDIMEIQFIKYIIFTSRQISRISMGNQNFQLFLIFEIFLHDKQVIKKKKKIVQECNFYCKTNFNLLNNKLKVNMDKFLRKLGSNAFK